MGSHEDPIKDIVSAGDDHDIKLFWTRQFAHLDAEQFPVLPSPNYTPRPSQSVEHNIVGLGWDSSAFKPSVFIRLAWAILQSRYTHCHDVLFGAASGVNGTAFPNRVQLVRDDTVTKALRRLQTQGEEMAAHSSIDLVDLVQEASSDVEAACDFKTLLVMTSAEVRPAQQQRERRRQSLVHLYALTLECTVSLSGLWVRFVHDRAVINSEQVERMSLQLGHVLRQILMQPQSLVGEISIAVEEDLQDIWTWNKNVTEALDTSLIRLLPGASSSHAEALAVDAWDGKLTYSQLDELSTQLAFRLAALGVSTGAIVPLCLEKSMWMSVAMIAVMKTGAASMCLNANHPVDYLRNIVHCSHPSALICSATTSNLAGQLTDRPIIALSDDFFRKLNIELLEPLPAVKPSDSICVVPSSGNSLAILTHSNFATALLHQTRLFDVTHDSRIYDLDSYSSDITWLSHLLAFTTGACLCVPSDRERKGNLADSLSRFQASVLITTAASAKNIDLSQAVDLQTLVVIGEVTPKIELPPHVRLISAFGLASCTIMATYATEQQVLDNEHCLGQGLASNTWIVSTESQELCALGEVGELWLESPLVGAGYVHDEKKTDGRFVTNPEFLVRGWRGVAGRQGRLCRTGTLVRYLPDGMLAYVGFRDAHVGKIRGHSVDLFEVESHMRQLLGGKIAEVAAEVISAHGQPAPVLAAFIMPAGDLSDSSFLEKTVAELADALMTTLKKTLPSHMLPVVYLPIRTLPRKTTGEVDRKKLRRNAERKSQDPGQRTARHAIRPKQAMTILEVQLQQLWAQILGIKNRSTITANSNWLQLGGDESSAMRLSHAAQNWGLDISTANVLARPRLADMAEHVKHFHRASIVTPEGVDQPMRRDTFGSSFPSASLYDNGSQPPLIVATNRSSLDRRRSSILVNGKEEMPAAPMALMTVTAMQKRALLGSTDRTFMGTEYFAFDLQSSVEPARVIEACRRLVQHFDILRTIFVQIEDTIYQTILPEVEVPIERQQITGNMVAASEAVIEKDSCFPLTLGRSFLRIYILQQASKRIRMILRTNQAYIDDRSVFTLYIALSDLLAGKALAPVGSFRDTMLQGPVPDGCQSYWRNLLLGASLSVIPKASNCPQEQSTMTTTSTNISLPHLPQSVTGKILFLAACSITLAQSSDSAKEVLFGHIISTRPTSQYNLVGPCKNLIPIRVRTSDTSRILRQVQEQLHSLTSGGSGIGLVDFASVANDNCLLRDGNGTAEKGDFGLVTEWIDQDRRRDGVQFLGQRQEVGRSNAVVIKGFKEGDTMRIEMGARSDVQDRDALEQMVGLFKNAVKELMSSGQSKRKVSMAEGFW